MTIVFLNLISFRSLFSNKRS